MGLNKLNKLIVFLVIYIAILVVPFVSADIEFFDNINVSNYNVTADKFIGDGRLLTNLTESQIDDLQHTVDTNRSDTEINTLIDNRVIQSFIEALGFVTGAHTVDTNRSDADILSVASVYNDTAAINTKLDATDQRYNETSLINAVNTTSNIEGLGFITGAHTTDTNRSDAEINTLIDNRVVQSFIEALGFVTGAHTVDTNRSDADILNVASVYNDTTLINTKLDQTDQRYNDTSLINSVNTTANIEALNFVQGPHTVDTDTNRTDSEINTLIDNRVIQSFVEALGFVTGAHTVDTNETTRFTNLVNINCTGTDKVIGVQANGTVLCGADVDTDTISNETDLVNAVNTTSNIEALGFTQGPHTVDTNRSDADILSVASVYNDSAAINAKLDATDQRYNETDLIDSVNQTSNIEALGFVTGSHTVDTDTTYTNGSGLSLVGTEFNHSDTSSQSSSDNSGRTYIQDILLDSFGHITGITTATETVVDTISNETDLVNSVNTTANIESLGFTQGPHTVDTNRSDADILSVAAVYNDTSLINTKLDITDQRYNETSLINNSWNQSLADTLYMDINQDDWIDTTGDSVSGAITFTQAAANLIHNFEFDFFPWGQSTVGLRVSNDSTNLILQALGSTNININDDLSVKGVDVGTWLHNQTAPANSYTDSQISSVNTTSNIESLGFTQGPHTVDTDTNESVRFGNLVDADCPGGQLVIGVQSNGTVLCATDQTGGGGGGSGKSGAGPYLHNDTDEIFFNDTFANNTYDNRYLNVDGDTATENIIFTKNATGSGTVNSWLDQWRGITSLAASSFFFDGTGSFPRWYFRDDGVGFLQLGIDNVRVYGGANFTAEDSVRFNSLTTCTALETDGSGYVSCGTDDVNDTDASATNELQNLWSQISSDSGSTTANTQTDVLTVAGSGSVSTSISGDTLTISGTDSDTTYTNGSGINLVGTQFNHSDTSSQASSDNSGRTYIQDILLDSFGHITSITTATETVTDTTLSEEQVEDFVGGMVTGNTETGISVTYQDGDGTLDFIVDLGTAIEKGELANSGTLSFDWADSEVADDLTISGSGSVADGALSSNVPLENTANTFSQEQTFSGGINVTDTNQLKIGACYDQWNGTCLNTYCQGTLIQSIGCA